MAVYVDNARLPYRRMKMCHMLADTYPELLRMAEKIGVQAKWYQPFHFDICLRKRVLALENGAVEISIREAAKIRKRLIADEIGRIETGQPRRWPKPAN